MNPPAPASRERLATYYSDVLDRDDAWNTLKYEKENNPVFAGLDEKQIGRVLNRALGYEKGSKFEAFDSKTRYLDAFGHRVRDAFTNAPGNNLLEVYQGKAPDVTYGEAGASVGRSIGKTFGVADENLGMWEETGRSLPAGLGTLAMAAVPVVGLPAMVSATYGGAVNEAKMGGASGEKAFAVGTLDTAVNLLFLKTSGPLSNKFAAKSAEKLIGIEGTKQAMANLAGLTLKEGAKQSEALGGRAIIQAAKEQGKITGKQAFGALLKAEAKTEAVQSAIGIAGQLAHEGILDIEGLKQNMADPNYWATTLLAEGTFAAMGTVAGRVRENSNLVNYEGVDKLFNKPTPDAEVVSDISDSAIQRARQELIEKNQRKQGADALEPLNEDAASAVQTVASSLNATGGTDVNANAAQAATGVIQSQSASVIEKLIRVATNIPPTELPVLPAHFQDVSVQSNAFSFKTPAGEIKLTRADATGTKDAWLAKHTPEQQADTAHIYDIVKQQIDNRNITGPDVMFPDKFDARRRLSYESFLDQTGLRQALKNTGAKLVFSDLNGKTTWIDKFLSSDRIALSQSTVDSGTLFYISATKSNRLSDIHEMGHLFDKLLEQGGWGETSKLEWQALKSELQAAKDAGVGADPKSAPSNMLGAAFGREVLLDQKGKSLTTGELRKYYGKPREIAAQAFKGYMMSKPTKFKRFMETSFPELDKLFKQTTDTIRKLFTKKDHVSKITKADINRAWQPGQVQANMFFEALFKDASAKTTEAEVMALVKKYKLSDKATESLIEATLGAQTLAGKAVAFEAVESWAKSPSRVETELLDRFGFVKLVNESSMTLDDLMEGQVGSLPNVRRLQRIEPDDGKADMLSLVKQQPVEKQADLERYVDELDNLPIRGGRALSAINSFLAEKHLNTDGPDALFNNAVVMLQLDAILGRWMRGELKGQDGRFMWDKNVQSDAFYKRKLLEGEHFDYGTYVAKQKIDFAVEFPILNKHVKEIRTGKKSEGHVGDDGSLTMRKTKHFESREEAQAFADTYNNDSRLLGYTFKVDTIDLGPKDRKVRRYSVKFEKDDRTTIVAEYHDELSQMADSPWAGLKDESTEVKRYFDEEQKAGLRDVYREDYTKHLVRVTKARFKHFRRGVKHALTSKTRAALEAYEKALVQSEEISIYHKQLAKELEVGSGKVEDVLLGLAHLAQSDDSGAKQMQLYLMAAGEDFNTLFRNFAMETKMWVDADFDASYGMFLAGKIPPAMANTPGWRTFDSGMEPREHKWFSDGARIFELASDGGLGRAFENGVVEHGFAPSRMLGKVAEFFELLHRNSFAGMQALGESHPEFLVLAKATDQESPSQDYNGQRLIDNLRTRLIEEVDPITGETRMVVDPEGAFDDRAYMAVHGSPRLSPVVNRIMLMQQEAGGVKFADIASNNLDVGRGSGDKPKPEDVTMRAELAKEANNLIAKTFDMNNPKHRQEMKDLEEVLMRSYMFQEKMGDIAWEGEMTLFREGTALGIAKSLEFDGRPEDAQKISTQLLETPENTPEHSTARIKVLASPRSEGGLEWDLMRAVSFDDKWIKNLEAVNHLRDYMKSTPGFISEKRMRQWIVPYAEKQSGDRLTTGLRDFDTAAEAYAFIAKAKANPNFKLSKNDPIDNHLKRAQYRTGTNHLDEVVNKVVESRKALLEFVLESKVQVGAITEAEVKNYLKVLSGMAEDIAADMSVTKINDMFSNHRMFKAGREELDMAFQQEESGWRMSINYARKRTDAIFQLYLDDERINAKPHIRDRFINAKDALRSPDGEGQRAASKLAFTYFLLGNLSSAMIEAVQWPLSLSHMLVAEGGGIIESFTNPGKLFAQSAKASMERLRTGSDKGVWSDEHLKAIRYAEKSNRLGIRPMQDISTDNTQAKLEMSRQKIAMAVASVNPGVQTSAKNAAKGMAGAAYKAANGVYAHFSRINAELSIAASYDTMKKKLYGNRTNLTEMETIELYEAAIRVANKANGSWGRGNRPFWFNSKDSKQRTVAQLAWSLQGFASNFVANHLRLMKFSFVGEDYGLSKAEITANRKALAVMTTMQVAGLGVMGHTLAGGMSTLVETVFGYDPETEVKDFLATNLPWEPEDNMAMSDLIMYGGAKAAGIPVDFQARMAVSGLGPLSSYEGWNMASFGGPVLNTLGQLVDGWNTISQGDGSAESYMRYGTGFLPTGVQRAVRMELFDDGKVLDRAGRFIMEPEFGERMASYAGFSSRRYSDYMKAKTKNLQANAADGRERKSASRQIASALDGGQRFEALSMLQAHAKRLGMEPKKLARSVADYRTTQTHGPEVTIGSGPNAQRAARHYKSPLPQAREVDRERSQFQTLDMLGQLPMNWKQSMFQAAQRDALIDMMPGLTGGQANDQLRNPNIRSTVLSVLQQPTGSQRPVGLGQLTDGLY